MKIKITKEVVGESVIKSSKENPERIEKVPLYKMLINNQEFAVTRDTNHNNNFLKIRGDFSENSECPPSANEYKGFIRADGKKGHRIQLYEEGVDDGSKSLIQGKGEMIRSFIQIHKGEGWSRGCFILNKDKNQEFTDLISNHQGEISVEIEER